MGMGACLTLINLRRWREWLAFLVVASVIAIPQLLWSTHGSAVSTRAFIGWKFGWDNSNENFFWFWFKNTGLFIPLLIILKHHGNIRRLLAGTENRFGKKKAAA